MEKVTSDVMLNFRVLHRVQTTLHNLKTTIQKRPNAFRGALKYKMHGKLIVKSSSDRSGEQGWRSGESARLPPMWPGFDSGPVSYVG